MRQCKNWIESYLEYAYYSEAPTHLHWWVAVSTIAAALGRKIYMDQKYFIWTPNFYIIFVAPPGVATKSTTLNIAQGLLMELPAIRLGPNAVTWQQLIVELEQATEAYMMADGSMFDNSSLTFMSGELGSLLNFDDAQMINVLTDLWDGRVGEWKKATKSQGTSKVRNPWINIIGCTTPAWLRDSMPSRLIEGGFASRAIWVYAEKKAKLSAYPKYMMPSDEWFVEKSLPLLNDLEELSQLAGEFIMTPEAIMFGTEWYNEHFTSPPKHLWGEDLIGYRNRKQAHMQKLAMVLSASETSNMIIEKRHMVAALDKLTETELMMPSIFRTMHTSFEMKETTSLVGVIQHEGPIEEGECYALFAHRMSKKEFEEAIANALFSREITRTQRANSFYLEGRQSQTTGKVVDISSG